MNKGKTLLHLSAQTLVEVWVMLHSAQLIFTVSTQQTLPNSDHHSLQQHQINDKSRVGRVTLKLHSDTITIYLLKM